MDLLARQLLKGVEGAASSVDGQIVVADGTTGKKIAFTDKQTLSATSPITLSNTPAVIASAAPVIAIPAATNTVAGHATAAQITKLDGITAGANVTTTNVVTLTNKGITKREVTIASSATPTPNSDITDIYTITALAEPATFGAPSGTPTQGQALIIRAKDDGTPRALAYNVIYREGEDIKFPTLTIAGKTMYLALMWNSTDSKWDLTGVVMNI